MLTFYEITENVECHVKQRWTGVLRNDSSVLNDLEVGFGCKHHQVMGSLWMVSGPFVHTEHWN